jgi:hypothetical protein
MIAEVYVDVYPHHLESGAEPPEIVRGEPDFAVKEGGRRFFFEIEVKTVRELEGLDTSMNQIYADAFKEDDDE